MGDILFIRVSAATYDEKAVLGRWPVLYASVWPDAGAKGVGDPAKIVRQYIPAPERGVLELVDAFVDYARFGDMTDARRKALADGAERLKSLREQMDAALGDRNVPKAHTLTLEIEDALDAAERSVRTP